MTKFNLHYKIAGTKWVPAVGIGAVLAVGRPEAAARAIRTLWEDFLLTKADVRTFPAWLCKHYSDQFVPIQPETPVDLVLTGPVSLS